MRLLCQSGLPLADVAETVDVSEQFYARIWGEIEWRRKEQTASLMRAPMIKLERGAMESPSHWRSVQHAAGSGRLRQAYLCPQRAAHSSGVGLVAKQTRRQHGVTGWESEAAACGSQRECRFSHAERQPMGPPLMR